MPTIYDVHEIVMPFASYYFAWTCIYFIDPNMSNFSLIMFGHPGDLVKGKLMNEVIKWGSMLIGVTFE